MGEPRAGGAVEALYAEVRARVGTAAADGLPDEPVLREVAPGIQVLALRSPTLPPAAHTNVYLVGPAGGPLVVVDPGSPYPDQQAVLDAVLMAQPISAVLLTHHHGDHVGGAAALAARWGVPIVAHPITARLLEGIVEVTRGLEDGEVLGAAGRAHPITAVHTPGHAEGHLCFEVGGATLAGDMVAGVGTILIDPAEGDMARYLASLERLLARPATALLPAHGPAIPDGPGKLREYLAHRQMRERRVWAALTDAPATLAQLVTRAYADTPAALWPIAERSLEAHLIKLVREGRAAIDDAGYSARPWH